MKKLAIIQARMASSRLPGKVMLDISGRPLLQHMLARVQKSRAIDGMVLATTIDPSDDILEQFCQSQHIPCYRGNLHDVLDRYYQAAAQFHADMIIRLTADCPIIDPDLIDLTVTAFLGKRPLQNQPYYSQIPDYDLLKVPPFDFAANRLPPPWKRTLPIGLDVEVCTFSALEHAWNEASERYQREHVMPYLYEGISFYEDMSFPEGKLSPEARWHIDNATTPRGFRVTLLNHDPDYGSLRWTVDTPADLEFVRQIFSHFNGQDDFTWLDVLALLEKEPELASINEDVKHKSAFDVDQRTPHS